MQRNNNSKKRKSGFNPNRTCYLTADGEHYCYEHWDDDAKRVITQMYEVGKDGLTEEWTIFLDESDHDMDLQDRYEGELRDPLFDAKAKSKADSDDEDAVDPWDTIADKGGSPENVMFAEPENPQAVQVRRVIDEECTESHHHSFGCGFVAR